MRRICIINQKGGVGKTTTAVNLAAGLSRKGKKVLLLDLDPQGNTTFSLEWKSQYDLYDFLKGRSQVSESITVLGKDLDLLGTKDDLIQIQTEIGNSSTDIVKMSSRIRQIKGYDYLIIDCSPVIGALVEIGMLAANEAIIPSSTDILGLRGTSNTIKMIEKTNEKYDHDIKVTKIVPTLYDQRNRVCKKTLEIMNNIYYDQISEPIRVNSKLKEAPEHHKSIFSYAKESRGAEDYANLVNSVLSDEAIAGKKHSKETKSAAMTA